MDGWWMDGEGEVRELFPGPYRTNHAWFTCTYFTWAFCLSTEQIISGITAFSESSLFFNLTCSEWFPLYHRPKCYPKFTICYPKFTIRYPKFTICYPKFTICYPKFTICYPKFTICYPKFTICHSKFTICHTKFTICHTKFTNHHRKIHNLPHKIHNLLPQIQELILKTNITIHTQIFLQTNVWTKSFHAVTPIPKFTATVRDNP